MKAIPRRTRATSGGRISGRTREKGGHSIARETSVLGTGMSMTIIDPSIFHGSPDLMDALLESVKSAGSVNADGEVCDIIEASYAKGQRTRVFWISRRDHLPRMLEETVRGKRDIVVRERWRDVVVNGAVSKDRFRWKPPAGWEEYRLQSLDDGLLRPGSEAPDFDLVLLDGSRFRLSEHRGTVVWLSFWRLSCIPCRTELPHLQSLQDRYAGEGLVVLGFNCADGRGPAEEFLREKIDTVPERRRYDGRRARSVLEQISNGEGAERPAAQLHHRYPRQDRRRMVRLREGERSGGKDTSKSGNGQMSEVFRGGIFLLK